jgi:hypothetical protein
VEFAGFEIKLKGSEADDARRVCIAGHEFAPDGREFSIGWEIAKGSVCGPARCGN